MNTALLVRAMIGGLVGTILITVLMYIAGPLAVDQPVDIPGLLGVSLEMPTGFGILMHFITGTVVYPALYALLVYPVMGGSPLFRGAIFGVALWMFGETVIMPALGAGFLSVFAGGPMALAGSFFSHLLYGTIVGVVAGSAPSPGRSRLLRRRRL